MRMPKLVIHQEKVEDPQVLVDICPFGAMEEKDGKLSINACKICGSSAKTVIQTEKNPSATAVIIICVFITLLYVSGASLIWRHPSKDSLALINALFLLVALLSLSSFCIGIFPNPTISYVFFAFSQQIPVGSNALNISSFTFGNIGVQGVQTR